MKYSEKQGRDIVNSVEKWGDDVDNAVELALKDLKLTRDQVKVTVLEESSKGFFGIGKKLAKVRVERIVEEKAPEKKPVKEVKAPAAKKEEAAPQPKKENAKNRQPEKLHKEKKQSRPRKERVEEETAIPEEMPEEIRVLIERPADLKEDNDNPAKAFLENVTREMGLNVTVKVSSGADCVYAEIEGPDTGTIIGKRGQTLDSIQYLTSLVVNKDRPGYTRVIVDAEGYKEKRERTLEKLAYRLADKAVKSGRPQKLEPMNPYERKVIHTTLQARPDVRTRSEGDEPYRKVVIEPVK